MPTSCKYTKPVSQCGQTEWLVAFMCDKCDADGTAEVCDDHYHKVFMSTDVRLACGDCHATLSFSAERFDHSATEEVIN